MRCGPPYPSDTRSPESGLRCDSSHSIQTWTLNGSVDVVSALEKLRTEVLMLGRPLKALLILGITLAAAGAVATAAAGDGLPVLGVDVGAKGIAARVSPVRYVTLPTGRDTLVARTALN